MRKREWGGADCPPGCVSSMALLLRAAHGAGNRWGRASGEGSLRPIVRHARPGAARTFCICQHICWEGPNPIQAD